MAYLDLAYLDLFFLTQHYLIIDYYSYEANGLIPTPWHVRRRRCARLREARDGPAEGREECHKLALSPRPVVRLPRGASRLAGPPRSRWWWRPAGADGMGWECGTGAPRLTACVRVPFDASFSAGLPSLQSIKGQSTGHPSIYPGLLPWRGVHPAPARGGRERAWSPGNPDGRCLDRAKAQRLEALRNARELARRGSWLPKSAVYLFPNSISQFDLRNHKSSFNFFMKPSRLLAQYSR